MDEGASSSQAEETDDDPVVREIPIIHSTRLENSLYLFQYPLRKRNSGNEHNIKKCFFKPQNQEVKLELGINVDSPNFDTVRAEFMAQQVDGDKEKHKKEKQIFFENEMVDKVFLTSERAVKQPENYAVAAYNGREIHLTSLKGIFQFRPIFPYLEKGLKRSRKEDSDSEEEQAGPSTAQQVTVRFKQTDERWKKTNDISYKALQARRAEEPWKACTWHDKDSTFSSVERLKLIADTIDDVGQAKTLSKEEYIKLLVPEDEEQTPLKPTLPSHVLSLHALRALPLEEQCRLLLKDVQIIRFQEMLMLLLTGNNGLTPDTLLKTLQKVAVLVRGNWVVKSEVLYPADTFSAISGVPAEMMCRARDYVLYLFTKHQYVERKKVSSVMKIPSEEVKEIFTGISKLRTHNKGWELSLPTDRDFIGKHVELVNKTNAFWEHRYRQLGEFLKDTHRQRRKSKSASESEEKPRQNSVSDSESGAENKKSPVVARKNNIGVTVEVNS